MRMEMPIRREQIRVPFLPKLHGEFGDFDGTPVVTNARDGISKVHEEVMRIEHFAAYPRQRNPFRRCRQVNR
jgi:hypothetical protein